MVTGVIIGYLINILNWIIATVMIQFWYCPDSTLLYWCNASNADNGPYVEDYQSINPFSIYQGLSLIDIHFLRHDM